jgi:pimeloyl-ACP methyl ester carboxylesterase
MGRLIVIGAASLVTVGLGACSSAEPTPSPTSSSRDVIGPETVAFRTADGLTLKGTLFVPVGEQSNSGVAVVLLHMFPADQTSWHEFAEAVSDEGFPALTFDFRGYGESDGPREIELIDRDVEGAIDFLVDRGEERIILIGASMGGTAALIVGIRRPETRGIAALSAPPMFMGLDSTEAIRSLTVPSLFMAAENDGSAAFSAEEFADTATKAGSDSFLLVVPGRDHGTRLLEGEQADPVRTELMGFIRETGRDSS